MSHSFTVEIQIELSTKEILFLKNINWDINYSHKEKETISKASEFFYLDEKGIILMDDDENLYLTSIGEQILHQILNKEGEEDL